MERIAIGTCLKSYSVSSFDGKIDDVIQMLANDRDDALARGFFDITIDASQYYDDVDIYLNAKRLETDEEFERRKAMDKKMRAKAREQKKTAEAKERELYEKLKKKYEGK